MEEGKTIAEMFESFLALTQKSVAREEQLDIENERLRSEMMEMERMLKEKDKLLEGKNAEIEEFLSKQKNSLADFVGSSKDLLIALRTSGSVEHHQFVAQSTSVHNQQLNRQLMSMKIEIERLNRLNKELDERSSRKQY
jgi:hypothetical protein